MSQYRYERKEMGQMDAAEYQRIRNQMCLAYGRNRMGCEGACPLAWLCTPEDGQGREEEVVKAVEAYRAQKAAERGEYAREKRESWIAVEERLPEQAWEWVLVCLKKGAIRMAIRLYSGEFKEISSLGIRDFYANNPVVAWMPLPEPYEND